MWRALIAGIVFQHPSIQSLLRELGRNPALLELCGFDPLPFQGAAVTELREGAEGPCAVTHPAAVRSTVPGHWNFSRFLGCLIRLENKRGLVSGMTECLRASLFEEVPDFGRHLGYDGKAIESHSSGRVAEGKGCASDPDADWGKHETSGVNGKTGAVWKQVKSWFGYGLHLIADTDYEVPVAFEVTRASVSEARVLPEMLGALFGKAPEVAERCDDFSADRGLDGGPLKARLWDEWTIRPLIDTRLMWQAGKEEPDYIDRGFGFETHYTRGLAKMKTRIGLALAVMMALALGQVRAGRRQRASRGRPCDHVHIVFRACSEPAGSARPPGPDRRYPATPPQRCARENRHSAHASSRNCFPGSAIHSD